ncbi:DUF3347 domain-containing protein [uncultured Flavobacterium sp.]|uniref:DUF3347 domain-containing protein n=1 Tax=uncultured Flavobacterium sp. TaxID=165435 RepID=UPI00292FFD86|nr:DUF3347 domain-containing protein [uncultured Flavobacterium sp.]
MKNIILSTIIMAFVMVSCNQKNKETVVDPKTTQTNSKLYACSMHPEITGKKDDKCSKCGMELTEPVPQTDAIHKHDAASQEPIKSEADVTEAASKSNFSINKIVGNYLQMKNALVKDDGKAAANAGKELFATLNKVDLSSIDAKLKTEYVDIADDAKEHAEHIGDNSSKIDHQREHFVMLSKDVNDLIQVFGTTQKLYQDYCPMANDGKGAVWISEIKEIKNPYYGSKMGNCGSIKKTF